MQKSPVPNAMARGDGGLAGPVVRDENWVSRVIDGDTVLVPIRAGAVDLQFLYVLNATASWVWARLDGARTPEQLARDLTEAFSVSLDRAEQDIRQLITTLGEAGLVRQAPVADHLGTP